MVETDPLEKWRPSHAKSRALWIGSLENASDPPRIPCGSHLDPPFVSHLGCRCWGCRAVRCAHCCHIAHPRQTLGGTVCAFSCPSYEEIAFLEWLLFDKNFRHGHGQNCTTPKTTLDKIVLPSAVAAVLPKTRRKTLSQTPVGHRNLTATEM